MRVFADKMGMLPDDESDAFELGHLIEPVLLSYYAKTTGLEVTGKETVVHPSYPWARANLDGWVKGHRIIVEAKAVSGFMMHHWDKLADDGCADYVRLQAAWQMFCADAEQVSVVAMLGGPSGFRVYTVARDRELEMMIFERCQAFWQDVQAGQAPDIDASRACRTYLEATYPNRPEKVTHVVEENSELDKTGIARLCAAAQEKEKREAKDAFTASLMKSMGELGCSKLDAPQWSMTWADGKPPRFTAKRAKGITVASVATQDGDAF